MYFFSFFLPNKSPGTAKSGAAKHTDFFALGYLGITAYLCLFPSAHRYQENFKENC
ncbi:Uncharacterized protein APZ42_005126 [Daphnia magna]|uniref:Uncharacterized protein n=1 Tax=Daphnia magna TaxID=35525 RepID=A0A164GMH3_9CRUS|nr:Uncharacterized protein APZ42_005126 [Daphnia magna]